MGADGHIYRGRTDEQRLPDLPQTAPVRLFINRHAILREIN